jgi:UDP-N-acetylglucosamine 2-epimerase (non-hydrolysing)
MTKNIRIICVCGARPNFMKIAPIMRTFKARGGFDTLLVHTGQHYDENMSKLFFDDLGISKPDINLEVGSASHAVQTAEIMRRFEPVVTDFKPDYVLVVGDVNSTIACGLVSVKLGIKLIHVEAGLRSFDRSMPEEINRVLTDAISDLLFVTEQSAIENLKNEGVNSDKVHFVGNVMIDTLLANRDAARKSGVLQRFALEPRRYVVITLHRPRNVDNLSRFEKIVAAFEEVQKEIRLVFPIHPRTKSNLVGTELWERLNRMQNMLLIEPVGYLDFLCLMDHASLVITDSGGIQEETTILGVPCMTLRENTERPVTISEGTNRLVKVDTRDIVRKYKEAKLVGLNSESKMPKFWDGHAADRILEVIQQDAAC